MTNQIQIGLNSEDKTAGFRRFIQFHEDPEIIQLWIGLTGPLLRWLTLEKRRSILAAGAVLVALKYPAKELLKYSRTGGAYTDLLSAIFVAALSFGFLYICFRAAANFASLPSFVKTNPQMSLHAFFWMLLVVLWTTSPDSGVWRMTLAGFVVLLPYFLWRVGYMFMSAKRNKMAGTVFKDHLMYLWPVYGGSNTPYGKGLDYLSRNEARDEAELAKSQLAGIRLLLLALFLSVINKIFTAVVFGEENAVKHALGGFSLNLPYLKQLIKQTRTAPVAISWVCLYLELIRDVLDHAIKGHIIIAYIRIAGFYVFRNTYKPLLAVSVVEFWNRYYYYFKEIMAEFFFYPTFMGWFRKWQKLRLFAAVFMAAFFGNMYYHLIKLSTRLSLGDFQGLWDKLHPRLFYCFMLATGIFISMVREQSRAGQRLRPNAFRHYASIFGVWTFYSIISIWNQKNAGSFIDVTRFFLGLIGIA